MMLDDFFGVEFRTGISVFRLGCLAAISVFLSSCASTPRPVIANAADACGINSGMWKQIPTPPQRDALLDLDNKQSINSTRKNFIIASTPIELWFEDKVGNLLSCRVRKQELCGGGIFSTVIFVHKGTFWDAEPVFTTVCSD